MNHYLPHTIYKKWYEVDHRFKCKNKSCKPSRKKYKRIFLQLWGRKVFLKTDFRTQKEDRWTASTLKTFAHQKMSLKKVNRHATHGEKISRIHMSNKGLGLRFEQILHKYINIYTCIFIYICHWMANEHMKSYTTSLVIRELQIKTTTSYRFSLTKMAKIKLR